MRRLAVGAPPGFSRPTAYVAGRHADAEGGWFAQRSRLLVHGLTDRLLRKPASEVTSAAWAASASAAHLRSAGSGTNPKASGYVEPPNLSSERNRSAIRVHDSGRTTWS